LAASLAFSHPTKRHSYASAENRTSSTERNYPEPEENRVRSLAAAIQKAYIFISEGT
jgi:hypothetical protein